MYAENVEDIRALFRTTFEQAGFQPKVDEDGDFTWDDEVQGADASEKYPGGGVLYMTYLGEPWDMYRVEVMYWIMRPVPEDRVAELRLLIGLVNSGIAKGTAFVLIDMGEPNVDISWILTVVTGVATDVVSEKMAGVIPVLLRSLMEQMAPAYSAVLSGKATAEQAMAKYWPGY